MTFAEKIEMGEKPKGLYFTKITKCVMGEFQFEAYEKAKGIDPSFLLNYLELARAYKRNNEKQKAIQMLQTLTSLQNKTEDDVNIKAEAVNFLKEIQ